MNKISALLVVLASSVGFGQIKISEKSVNIEGAKNGYFIEIPYGTEKQVDKALKQELKNWKGSFKDGKYYFIDNCENKKMGANTFDVYAMTEPTSTGGGSVNIAVDLGGAFLSSGAHSEQYKLMEGILYEFAVAMAKDVIQEEVEAQEAVLKAKEKELADMVTEQARLAKEIEDYKAKIIANEASIEESKKNQLAKSEEIKVQQGVIQEVIKKKEAVK